jgi:hypothetical protein
MTIYETKYGPIRHRDICKDDWKNIVTRYRRRNNGDIIPYTALTLQEPAIASIRAVEKELSRPWKKYVLRVTGSHRTCAFQAEKYREDPKRYAPPNAGLHTHGLAIDVHTGYLSAKLKRALLRHGWKQSRPIDEPWHFSYHLKA